MVRIRSIMFFLCFCTCFVLWPIGNAGAGLGANISAGLDEMVRDLPAGEMHTGILHDRVLSLARLDKYDGSEMSPPATLREWKQIYFEIQRAARGSDLDLPLLGKTLGDAGKVAPAGLVPLLLLNVKYDRLRRDALVTGDLVVRDGHLEIGPRRDPFIEERVFVAAPLSERSYNGKEVLFRLDPRDIFTNDRIAPRSIEIDFEDGRGFVSVTPGTPERVRYGREGGKTIRVRFAYEDGRVLTSSFGFDVVALLTPLPNDTIHVSATIPYAGGVGSGDAYVYLAEGHAAITEPLILIEGFDPDNTYNWNELYDLLNQQGLIENLRARGFDTILLNFTDGADYIQRDAFTVVELIRQVRQTIGPGRTIAMVGASMGGLVGRYALAYMESNGLPHDVRTFISFDSPQAGADVPLGLQYWLWFFASDSQDAAAYLADLDTPAARQMLYYHHTDPPGGTGQSDPLRVVLMNELSGLGNYPSLPRKVAIANGSGSGLSQGFGAGAQIIRWEYDSFLVTIHGNCWAVPNLQSGTIFYGLIEYLFIPWDEVTVGVSGTLPYDGAPGGWRDSMAQLGAVSAPYGDIVALYPNHCFIPTISSLALLSADPFADIAGDPNILDHTPFDAVYFPVDNQEHVEITAQNAQWFMDELTPGSTDVAIDGAIPGTAAWIKSVGSDAGRTRIRFTTPIAGHARAAIYDVAGRLVRVVADRDFTAGTWEESWCGDDASGRKIQPGIYLLDLTGSGFRASGKVLHQNP
jgi:hypothetical protein